jgi:hypothetical protein
MIKPHSLKIVTQIFNTEKYTIFFTRHHQNLMGWRGEKTKDDKNNCGMIKNVSQLIGTGLNYLSAQNSWWCWDRACIIVISGPWSVTLPLLLKDTDVEHKVLVAGLISDLRDGRFSHFKSVHFMGCVFVQFCILKCIKLLLDDGKSFMFISNWNCVEPDCPGTFILRIPPPVMMSSKLYIKWMCWRCKLWNSFLAELWKTIQDFDMYRNTDWRLSFTFKDKDNFSLT